jgi:hypothetical protein
LNPVARPLEREEAAAAHNRGVDLFVAIPAIEATVRVKNSGEQFVYLVSPSAAGFFIEKV